MKRVLICLLTTLLSVYAAGCTPLVEDEMTIDLYASFYPIYALVDGLTEGVPDVKTHCLVQPQDGCLRDYQLSDWDLYLLASSADAVIMGGRGLESFESGLFGWGEQGPAVSAVLYNLELYNQDDKNVSGEEQSHFDGANPHLYMSLNGAANMLESIEATLVSLDAQYADIYSKNLQERLTDIENLSAETDEIRNAVYGNRVILMNEALAYVASDYGLEIDMVYERESGTGLYDNELKECLDALSKSDANTVLIEEQAPEALVSSLIENGYRAIRIDVFSNHAAVENAFGDYMETQRKNAAAVYEAFC